MKALKFVGERRIIGAVASLLAAVCTMVFVASAPANAEGVLVNSIIDSTKTDNPKRFCWVEQYKNDKTGNWDDAFVSKMYPDAYLDKYRDGHLDFGPDFTETNIVVDHWGTPDGPVRLHRVACPEPVSMCTGGDDSNACETEHRVDEVRRDEERDEHGHHSGGLDDVLGHVSVGVDVGGGGHDHEHDHEHGSDHEHGGDHGYGEQREPSSDHTYGEQR